jgi:hypothetical protein
MLLGAVGALRCARTPETARSSMLLRMGKRAMLRKVAVALEIALPAPLRFSVKK